MNAIQKLFHKCIGIEKNSHKLALSLCLGMYIAFSPFLGFHTILVFILGWLSRLNVPVAMTTAYVVNNPWTMIPIYSADYGVGYFLLHRFTNLGSYFTNPSWMQYIGSFFKQYLHMSQPCLWSFLIGGNLLAIALSILIYPFARYMFNKLVRQTPETPQDSEYLSDKK